MAEKIIVSPCLIQKPTPLAETDKEYGAELKEWMGEWYPDQSEDSSEDVAPKVITRKISFLTSEIIL